MSLSEPKKTIAMLLVGSMFAFAVVRIIQTGEERTRDLMHASERAAVERDERSETDRRRLMLLLETIKQSQAITASEEYTDRRINEMMRSQIEKKTPATHPAATRPARTN